MCDMGRRRGAAIRSAQALQKICQCKCRNDGRREGGIRKRLEEVATIFFIFFL